MASSPLHVLAVGVTDTDAPRLTASLASTGFAPEMQRAADIPQAAARLDRTFDVVVLGDGIAAPARHELAELARKRHLPAYIVSLPELVTADAAVEDGSLARLSGLLARRAVGGRAGAPDSSWLLAVLNTGRTEVYVLDAQTLRIKYANDEAVRASGFPRQRLVGMSAHDLTPGLGEEGYQALVRPLTTRERDVTSFEAEHRRQDGTTYPVELCLRWVQRGHEAMFIAVATDLTRERALRRELERERRRQRATLEAARDGVLVLAPSGEVLQANEAAARLYGRTVLELVGRRAQELVAPAPAGAGRAEVEPGRVVRATHRRKDGAPLEVEVATHPLDLGEERLCVQVVREASPPRAVGPADDALRAFLEADPDPVMIVDPEGRVTSWSQGAERLFGWSAAEVVGARAPIVPEDREQEWHALLRLADEGNALGPLQVPRRRRDGARLDIRLSLTPLRAQAGRPRGTVVAMASAVDPSRLDAERAHLIAAIDEVTDEVYLVEPDTWSVLFANEAAARACGATTRALCARSWPELAPGWSAADGAGAPYEATLVDLAGGEGRRRWVRVRAVEEAGARVLVVVASAAPPPREPEGG